jgi:hypothetical protein
VRVYVRAIINRPLPFDELIDLRQLAQTRVLGFEHEEIAT